MAQNTAKGSILAGAASGLVFIIFYLFLGIQLLISLPVTALTFVALSLVFRPKNKASNESLEGDQKVFVEETIRLADTNAKEIKKLARDLPKSTVRSNLEKLSDLSSRIAQDVRQDPKDAKSANRFLNYYGETVIKIANLYKNLTSHGISTQAIRTSMAKVEANLATLIKAFEMHLAQLQEDNLLDLDTELKVLEQTIEMEGLGDMIRKEEKQGNRIERPWQ